MSVAKRRQGYRLSFRNTVKQVEEAFTNLATTPPTEYELLRLENQLIKLEPILADCDVTVQNDLTGDELDADIEKGIELQQQLWDTQSKISSIRSHLEASSSSGPPKSPLSHGNGDSTYAVKLPKLSISNFDGNALQWQEFWDAFESTIDQNPRLSSVEKFNYLKAYLAGDAAQMVGGFRVTAANYDQVIEALKERYGNPEFAIFGHFEKLLALSVTQVDTTSLQRTFDQCESHIRSLVALGLSETMFGQVFTPIILSKLPRIIRVELHRKNGSTPWSLSTLRTLLREELKARQMGDLSLNDSKQAVNDPKQGSKSSDVHSKKSAPAQSTRSRVSTASALLQSDKQPPSCVFCGEKHFSERCNVHKASSERIAILKQKGLCFRCIGSGHTGRSCRRNRRCRHCGDVYHHASICTRIGTLHTPALSHTQKTQSSLNPAAVTFSTNNSSAAPNVAKGAVSSQSRSATTPPSNSLNMSANSPSSRRVALMQMALVQVAPQVSARVYLDSGSSRTFITTALARKLDLSVSRTDTISNASFEATSRRTQTYPVVHVNLPAAGASPLSIEALVTKHISCPVRRYPLNTSKLPILEHIPLADTLAEKAEDVEIDILLGGDYYFQVITKECIDLTDGIVLLGSTLGYIITGSMNYESGAESSFFAVTLKSDSITVGQDISRFWSLEDIGIRDDPYQLDDDSAINQFNDGIKRVDGRYEVRWPWKVDNPDLPDNKQLAYSRLRSLVRKHQLNASVWQPYSRIIQEQEARGIVEEVDQGLEPNGPVHYLPHHAIVRPDKQTTKVRIVYDASSKASRYQCSLNDCLLRGPVFLRNLCGIILRFRIPEIVLVADIEKAFHQLSLNCVDRDVTRFFWLKEPDKALTTENLAVYRFCRVPFGVVSSPFLLEATIKYHLASFSSPTAQEISDNIYLDNVCCGAHSADSAVSKYYESKTLFEKAAMNIRQWFSNSKEVLDSIPEEDKGKGASSSFLGLTWTMEPDVLSSSKTKLCGLVVATKRHLLKAASMIFDPCGFFSPVTIRTKILVQETWKRRVQWDDKLPLDLIEAWSHCANDLIELERVKLRRQFPRISEQSCWQLHCFCDASAKAYAAVIYIQEVAQESKPCLVVSKSRLSPLKTVTIPRLELMAVVLGKRLIQFVLGQLPLEWAQVSLWTDSACVLCWLRTEKVLSVFVRNRVKEVLELSGVTFGHVDSEHNPADLASRGADLHELQNSIWFSGPEFLQTQQPLKTDEVPSETFVNAEVLGCTDPDTAEEEPIDSNRFSDLSKLLRVTKLVLQFATNLKRSIHRQSVDEHISFGAAMSWWIKQIQTNFCNKRQKEFKNVERQLGVFYDSSGILRCKGRLVNAALDYNTVHPVLLPRRVRFTRLLIMKIHQTTMHGGVSHTLARIRRRYWIPAGRAEVKYVLHRCLTCRRHEGGPFAAPPMAVLPETRVTPTTPFQTTGIDYFGPLYLKPEEGSTSEKVYICIFTCTSTRAVHLEVVASMETDQFLLAFRRFVALCGCPQEIISDNAKYFKSADKTLQHASAEIANNSPLSLEAVRQVKWHFIPEFAPWMGGFYERLVGTVKRALRKVFGKIKVTLMQLQTVIAEVVSMINSRPLTCSDEPGSPALTPAHLIGRSHVADGFPGLIQEKPTKDSRLFLVGKDSSQALLDRWRCQKQVLHHFWNIWKSEYLTALRERHERFNDRKTVKTVPYTGCTVLIHENTPRVTWKLGIIEKLHASSDKQFRSATVRLSNNKTLVRPIRLLYPVECDRERHSNTDTETSTEKTLTRPIRGAAVEARRRILQQANESESE